MSVAERLQQAQLQGKQLKEEIKRIKSLSNDADVFSKTASFETAKLTPRCRRTLRGHLAKINSFAWGSDSRHILSASHDGKLIVWNAYSQLKVHAIPLRCTWVLCCAYSDNMSLVASGGLDNICSIYNLKRSEQAVRPSKELAAHTGYVSCCRFLTDRHIITASGDMSCILWDVETGKISRKFMDHTGDVACVAISPDKKYFLSGSVDQTVKLWDIQSGKCVQTFTGHTGDVNSVQFLPSGNSFVTGSEDCKCKLFDIRADRELMTYSSDKVQPSSIQSVALSSSGRLLFAGCDDYNVYAWDLLKGELVCTLNGHDDRVTGVGVSPDGMALATASWDFTLKVWA